MGQDERLLGCPAKVILLGSGILTLLLTSPGRRRRRGRSGETGARCFQHEVRRHPPGPHALALAAPRGLFISSGCLPRSLHQSRSVPESSQGPRQTSSPAPLVSSAWSWPAALPSPANSSVRNFGLPGRPCRCHREAGPTEERPGPPRHLAGHRVGLKVAGPGQIWGSRLALPAAKEPSTTAPVSAAIKSVVSGEVGASLANRKLNSRKKKLPAARHSHRPGPRARQAGSQL